MACCGQQRRMYATNPVGGNRAYAATNGTPIFQYVGGTALTVTGSATGRTYQFARPGARVEVDARDQAGVARVPGLRRVS